MSANFNLPTKRVDNVRLRDHLKLSLPVHGTDQWLVVGQGHENQETRVTSSFIVSTIRSRIIEDSVSPNSQESTIRLRSATKTSNDFPVPFLPAMEHITFIDAMTFECLQRRAVVLALFLGEIHGLVDKVRLRSNTGKQYRA